MRTAGVARKIVVLYTLIVGVQAVGAVAACKARPMARIDAVAVALRAPSSAAAANLAALDLPACDAGVSGAATADCARALVRKLGGTHDFRDAEPDQASAAAVGVLLARDGRGFGSGDSDAWMKVLRGGPGPGADVLRLAFAQRISAIAPRLGKRWDDEAELRTLLGDISSSVPGACSVYSALAAGKLAAPNAPSETADESACVRRDLERRTGPGGQYGYGPFRAAEAALAVLRAAVSALHAGRALSPAASWPTLDKALQQADAALIQVELKKVASGRAAATQMLADMHKQAGIELAPSAAPVSTIPVLLPGEHPNHLPSGAALPSARAIPILPAPY